jgi:hypothetical protein
VRTAAPDSSPAADVRFRDYLLENVYLRTTKAQRAEIIALWHEKGAISDPAEAKRRSSEAVFLVRTALGELAGLSTVGFLRVKDGRIFYAYRMFLREQDRVPYLMVAVIRATRDFLRTFQHPELEPAGMIHINENSRLMRPGIRKLFERYGYRYWGETPLGEDVWAFEFNEPPKRLAQLTKWRDGLKKLIHYWRRRQGSNPELLVISGVPKTTTTTTTNKPKESYA